VKDIKNGWVRWEHAVNPNDGGTDEINHFRWLYDLLPEENEEFLHCGHSQRMAVRYPGGKPYCSVCREFVEQSDREEFARWEDEHMKPLREAFDRMAQMTYKPPEKGKR